MKKSGRRIATVVGCGLALAAGGFIALGTASGREKSRATSPVKELAAAGEVALVPPHNAGVGGWCLARIVSGENGDEASARGGCQARGSESSTERGPFQGPIVAESGRGLAVLKESGPWVSMVVVLVKAPVAAVSLRGYKQIATHASALLPDHLRGAVVELRGRASGHPLRFPRFPHGHLIAWSRRGEPIPQTFALGPPLTFGVPVRTWSNGAPAQRGVCNVSVKGIAGLEQPSGGVVSEIAPHIDVLSREFLNCAHSYYLLNGKWPLEAYVLLDAARPGVTPARLPGMRPLDGPHGVFVGPGPEDDELARRVAGAWLVVAEGEDSAQRLALLDHLHVTLHLR